MRILIRFILIISFVLLSSYSFCQKRPGEKIQLVPPTVEKIANFAMWRTDFYICTGIAYAKSNGRTVDDFATFVGDNHGITWEGMRGKGIGPPVQVIYGLIMLYNGGNFKILNESDTLVTMEFNRPYKPYFDEGPMLGVTIEEFESCLWRHVGIMSKRIGFTFIYKIDGDIIKASMAMRK